MRRTEIFKHMLFVIMLSFAHTASADLGTAIIGSMFGKKSVPENLNKEKKANAEIARMSDPALFDYFYAVSDEGVETAPEELTKAGFNPYLFQENRILFVHDVVKAQDPQEINNQVGKHYSTVGKDFITERYVKFAKARGNHVSLYKPSIAYKIQAATGWHYPRPFDWQGLERCMVEFDRNNEVVSMLSRFHVFDTAVTVGAAKLTITEIVFEQPTAIRFQDGLKAEELQDALIREMK